MVYLLSQTKLNNQPLFEYMKSNNISNDKIDEIKEKATQGASTIIDLIVKGGTFYGPAISISTLIESYIKNEDKLITASVWCNGEYGVKGYCVGCPIILGKNGVKEMKKLPDAVFVVDPKEEHNAVAEAKKLGIPVFAMLDTNCDPDDATYPIASNDDSNRSIELITTLLADAIVDAKQGVLEQAYLEDTEDDVNMDDVIKRVEEQIAENERRRRQRNEERRRRQQERRNRRFNRNQQRDAQPVEKTEEKPAVKEAPVVEAKAETAE